MTTGTGPNGHCNKSDGGGADFFRAPLNVDAIMAGQEVLPSYRKATAFQAPRSLRFGVKFTF